jgi:chromosome segregation ATPase
MGFITKNANVILLFLILLSAASLVGATVFFQMNFEKINTEYNQKVQQLQLVSKELDAQQTILNKIKSELSLKAEREEQLGEKFTEVKTTAEQLETQKTQLERSKEQLESELENTEGVLRSTQVELEAKKDVVKTLTSENDKLSSQLDVCEDQRADYKEERDDCLDEKAQCTCP